MFDGSVRQSAVVSLGGRNSRDRKDAKSVVEKARLQVSLAYCRLSMLYILFMLLIIILFVCGACNRENSEHKRS